MDREEDSEAKGKPKNLIILILKFACQFHFLVHNVLYVM
jgi:hypothetical protein